MSKRTWLIEVWANRLDPSSVVHRERFHGTEDEAVARVLAVIGADDRAAATPI